MKIIDYATAWDPAFPTRIAGASEAQIRRLEAAANRPLPAVYREYLATMGRNDDGLFNDDEIEASIDHVLSLYENDHVTAPSDCVVIGKGTVDLDFFSIELAPPHRLWETVGERKTTLWADSFEGYFLQRIFMRRAYRGYAHSTFLSSGRSDHKIASAEAFARDHHYERLSFSDIVTVCYESADEAFCASQAEGRGIAVWLATNVSNERLESLVKRAQLAIEPSLTAR